MQAKNLIVVIIAVLLIITAGLAWFVSTLQFQTATSPTPDSEQTENTEPTFAGTVDELYSDVDSDFNRGYQAHLRGDRQEAIKWYRSALTKATDPTKAAHIEYRLARVTEKVNPVESIRIFKEVIDDPTYPDNQKKYAAMWIPIVLMRTFDDDPQVLDEAVQGQPYADFAGETVGETAENFYHYSLEFGSTGVADFAVAKSLAEDVRDGVLPDEAEVASTKQRIDELMNSGRAYIEAARTDPRNSYLLPRAFRQQARANAVMAQYGDEQAVANFDYFFTDAINQGLANKLDGAIRWDYFRYGYETFGEDSFKNTQTHLDFLVSHLDEYAGIKNYMALEKNNHYGAKDRVVVYANANQVLKDALLQLGWTEADFVN